MKLPKYELMQDGMPFITAADLRQVVASAMSTAELTKKDVTLVVHNEDSSTSQVIFHPDGSNENIWAIDRGKSLRPEPGRIYTNRGGGRFRCIANGVRCPELWNGAGAASTTAADFQNVESGWTFTAKGIVEYIGGTIEWDHSLGGHFEEVSHDE